MTKQIICAALAVAGLAACNEDRGITGPAAAALDGISANAAAAEGGRAAVYTLMNLTAGNAVAIFDRAKDGTLTSAGSVATGGTGTGAGLGSQGAVVLSEDGHWLYVVNAGSNDISIFRVDRGLNDGVALFAEGLAQEAPQITVVLHHEELHAANLRRGRSRRQSPMPGMRPF
jgi:hypothetical protein